MGCAEAVGVVGVQKLCVGWCAEAVCVLGVQRLCVCVCGGGTCAAITSRVPSGMTRWSLGQAQVSLLTNTPNL